MKKMKKLRLSKETLRELELSFVNGGTGTCPVSNETVSCGVIGTCGRFCPRGVLTEQDC